MKLDTFSRKLFFTGACFYVIVNICSWKFPFFWDTILTSTVSNWFYENGIGNGIAPLVWDAGHPTVFQIYLTLIWKIFDKNLFISHLAMLPFLISMVYGWVYILQKMGFNSTQQILGLLLLLVHPYILTQSTMVSYDIVQIAFFMWAAIGIVDSKKHLLTIGIWGMSLCSIRGQIIGVLCLITYWIIEKENWNQVIKWSFIALLPLLTWHIYHYTQTGWMLFSPSETWSGQREFTDFQNIVRNGIGIARGFVDYGVIALSFSFLIVGFHIRSILNNEKQRKIFILTLIVGVGLCGSLLITSNPISHRYFMIIHICFILLIVSVWKVMAYKKTIFSVILLAFISGHFWLYPKGTSNGWDVTLKYISYEKNRKELFDFLDAEIMNMHQLNSAFPLFCSLSQTNLEQDSIRMKDIQGQTLSKGQFIVFSSVCNDMKAMDKNLKSPEYELVHTFGKGLTSIELYKKMED